MISLLDNEKNMEQNQNVNQQQEQNIILGTMPEVPVPLTQISTKAVPKTNKFRMLFVLLTIVIVAGVIIAAVFYIIKGKNGDTGNRGVVNNVDSAKPPAGFPVDFSFYSQKKVLQNSSTVVNGETQSTYQFTTSLTPPSVYKQYWIYFSKAGWSISLSSNPDTKSTKMAFDATKGDDRAAVVVDPGNSATKAGASDPTIVTITFYSKAK